MIRFRWAKAKALLAVEAELGVMARMLIPRGTIGVVPPPPWWEVFW